MDVFLFKSKKAINPQRGAKNIRIYSCLNGYTINLLNSGEYDSLLISQPIGFVIDGNAAHKTLKKAGISVEKILGRELLDLAIKKYPYPVTIIGGSPEKYLLLKRKLSIFFNFDFLLITPPIFYSEKSLEEYARSIYHLIPDKSLVIIFIRSPLQDLLSGHLCRLKNKAVFINIGAVIDDILNERFAYLFFFQKIKLEWLYRTIVSPSRTIPKILKQIFTARLKLNLSRYHWKILK